MSLTDIVKIGSSFGKEAVLVGTGLFAAIGGYSENANADDHSEIKQGKITYSAEDLPVEIDKRTLLNWKRDPKLTVKQNLRKIVSEGRALKSTSTTVATIDTTWTNEEINNYLDKDTCVSGPYGEPCPNWGETVMLAAGDYIPPVGPPTGKIKLKTPGIFFSGPVDPRINPVEDTAVLRHNPLVSSPPAVLEVYSNDCIISNFRIGKGLVGIYLVEGYENTVIEKISADSSQGHLRTVGGWENEFAPGDNSLPSIIFTDISGDDIDEGFKADRGADPDFTAQSRWAGVINTTLSRVHNLGVRPPSFVTFDRYGAGSSSSTVLGDFNSNQFLDSEGASFLQVIYLPGVSLKSQQINSAANYNGEWGVGTGDPEFQTLAELGIGVGNFDTNPLTDMYGRPGWESESVGLQFIGGRAGSLHAVFDTNENGLADIEDFNDLKAASDETAPSYETITKFDGNENGLIDSGDFRIFYDYYVNPLYGNGAYLDCQPNGVGDLEDIFFGTSSDINHNGVPDECCETMSPPDQNFEGVESMRYLSFVTGTNPGQQTALRVHTGFNELDEPTYHYVQEPSPLSQASGSSDDSGTTFLHSNLGCEPFYTDWSQYTEPIYASGKAITPSRAFDIQAVDQICGTALEGNFSAPYTIGTSQWGDLTDACDPLGCGAPNGDSDFDDISAIVDKFRNLPVSPHKASADVAPEIPDQVIDFTDIPAVVDGFRGLPYSYATSGGC